MIKERLGAIFIGLIMILSAVGFAIVNIVPQAPDAPEMPFVINEPISGGDVVFILQNGKTLLRYYYDITDQKSLDDKITLEIFANQVRDYVVLNELESNETKLEIVGVVGREGKVIAFEDEINKENLFIKFCEIATLKPKECFLYAI